MGNSNTSCSRRDRFLHGVDFCHFTCGKVEEFNHEVVWIFVCCEINAVRRDRPKWCITRAMMIEDQHLLTTFYGRSPDAGGAARFCIVKILSVQRLKRFIPSR